MYDKVIKYQFGSKSVGYCHLIFVSFWPSLSVV